VLVHCSVSSYASNSTPLSATPTVLLISIIPGLEMSTGSCGRGAGHGFVRTGCETRKLQGRRGCSGRTKMLTAYPLDFGDKAWVGRCAGGA
jgi:hypothetical protein